MKRILGVLLSLLASIGIVVFLPQMFPEVRGMAYEDEAIEKSYLEQEIVRIEAEPHTVYKIYDSGVQIGILTNRDKLDDFLEEIYHTEYEESFPDSQVALANNVYIANEDTYFTYADVDDEILDYLQENELFAVRTTAVEFADDEGVYARIFVLNEELYEEAMNQYLCYFVDESELSLLNAGQSTPELKTYGSRSVGISVLQTITVEEAYASPAEILKTKEDILDYIEYGEDPVKYYYTVEKYDTVAGVGSKNNGLSATQVMNINSDQITSTDQVLSEGMVLCVSYFNPVFDVVVTKESMKKEVIYPETVYQEDEDIRVGTTELIQTGVNGSRNALYTERWINGVLVSGSLQSSVDTLHPIDEIIGVGTMEIPGVGTGTYRWPVENPHISCYWGCYAGHEAIDVQNIYNKYGEIYAADRGVVEINTYDSISGNYVIINHNNGMRTYYGHMNVPSPLAVGTIVDKGDYIGQLGMTGYATGPHTHFYIELNGVKVNPCNGYLDCTVIQ